MNTTPTEAVASNAELGGLDRGISIEEFSAIAFQLFGVFALSSMNMEQVVAVANAALAARTRTDAELDLTTGKKTSMTDDELRVMWRNAGGEFHGPRIETGIMPEAKLLPFLRDLVAAE